MDASTLFLDTMETFGLFCPKAIHPKVGEVLKRVDRLQSGQRLTLLRRAFTGKSQEIHGSPSATTSEYTATSRAHVPAASALHTQFETITSAKVKGYRHGQHI